MMLMMMMMCGYNKPRRKLRFRPVCKKCHSVRARLLKYRVSLHEKKKKNCQIHASYPNVENPNPPPKTNASAGRAVLRPGPARRRVQTPIYEAPGPLNARAKRRDASFKPYLYMLPSPMLRWTVKFPNADCCMRLPKLSLEAKVMMRR